MEYRMGIKDKNGTFICVGNYLDDEELVDIITSNIFIDNLKESLKKNEGLNMKTDLSKVTDDELIEELEKRGVKNECYR